MHIVLRGARRSLGHWVIIAAIAVVTLAYLVSSWRFGLDGAWLILPVWSALAAVLLLAAYSRTGSKSLLIAALLVLPAALILAAVTVLTGGLSSRLITATAVALCLTLPSYVALRAIRRVYAASTSPVRSDRAKGLEAIAFGGFALLCASMTWPNLRTFVMPRGSPDFTFTARHAGCYALQLGRWRPDRMAGHSHRGIVPTHVRLDTVFGRDIAYGDPPDDVVHRRHRERDELLVRPGWFRSAYWRPLDGDNVTLTWTTGHHGVKMALRRDGQGYVGHASAFTDVKLWLREPTTTVRAERVDCGVVAVDSARLIAAKY